MDMTYFAVFPPSLRPRQLKIAIVFDYQTFRFEAWLSARNRQIQRQYWELFKDSKWPAYRLVAPAKGVDGILEADLASGLDVASSDALTANIEKTTRSFVTDIERFLAKTS